MTRRLAGLTALGLVLGALTLPLQSASACDSDQDPRCVDKKAVCRSANTVRSRVQSYFSEPLPGIPTC